MVERLDSSPIATPKFISSKNYEATVKGLLKTSKDVRAAVAFWGLGAEKTFRDATGSLRVICNLESGATNPAVIRQLLDAKAKVRTWHRLHAKVLIGDNGQAIVGSANMSANGLSLEGAECRSWDEAAVTCVDATEIASMIAWFEGLWRRATTVDEAALAQVEETWRIRRANRPPPTVRRSQSLAFPFGFSREDVRDRPWFIAMWREKPSPEAERAAKRAAKSQSLVLGTDVDFYEDWPALPEGNAVLIDLRYGARGGVTSDGLWGRIFDEEFTYNDGRVGSVQIVKQLHDLGGRKIAGPDLNSFLKAIKPFVPLLWASQMAEGGEDGRVISLFDALRTVEEAQRGT